MDIKKFKGAIFDLDGTLLDSMWVWSYIDETFLKKRGIDVPMDYVEKIAHMALYEGATYTIERFGLDEKEEDLICEWNSMAEEAYAEKIDLKPGADRVLENLKKSGMKLSVATSSNELLYEPALKRNGIYDLFDAFTTSDEVGRGKDSADIYLKAAEKIGADPCECIVFEDIYMGIKCAKEAGFYTVAISEEYTKFEREKIIATADLYIDSWDELIQK